MNSIINNQGKHLFKQQSDIVNRSEDFGRKVEEGNFFVEIRVLIGHILPVCKMNLDRTDNFIFNINKKARTQHA